MIDAILYPAFGIIVNVLVLPASADNKLPVGKTILFSFTSPPVPVVTVIVYVIFLKATFNVSFAKIKGVVYELLVKGNCTFVLPNFNDAIS